MMLLKFLLQSKYLLFLAYHLKLFGSEISQNEYRLSEIAAHYAIAGNLLGRVSRNSFEIMFKGDGSKPTFQYLEMGGGKDYTQAYCLNGFINSGQYDIKATQIIRYERRSNFYITKAAKGRELINFTQNVDEQVSILMRVCLAWSKISTDFNCFIDPISDFQSWIKNYYIDWVFDIVMSNKVYLSDIQNLYFVVTDSEFLQRHADYVNGDITGRNVFVTPDYQVSITEFRLVPGLGPIYEFIRSMSWLLCNLETRSKVDYLVRNIDRWIEDYINLFYDDTDKISYKDVAVIKAFRFLRSFASITKKSTRKENYEVISRYLIASINSI